MKAAIWILFARTGLFAAAQGSFALVLNSWEASIAWWTLSLALANIACISLVAWQMRKEGRRYRDLFRMYRDTWKNDLMFMVASMVVIAPTAFFPNIWLGEWLFGSSEATLNYMVRPLPMEAVFLSLALFPLSQGLAELPLYAGYSMNRLKERGIGPVWAVGLPGFMLSLQHIAAPLVFDWNFILWRALMFLPFAIFACFLLFLRPRLLPFFAIIHAAMNLGFAAMMIPKGY